MKYKALIAVDLHGTIADKNEQHSGEYDPAAYALQPGAVEALQELKDDGHEVAIWTCWATDEARQWLDENKVPYDYINEEAPDHGSPKIDADVYLDDKAVRHDGDWNRTLAQVYATGKLDKRLCIIKAGASWDVKQAPDGKWAIIAKITGNNWMEMGGRRFDSKTEALNEMRHLMTSDESLRRQGPSEMALRKTAPYAEERRDDGWYVTGPIGTWNEQGPFDTWEEAHAAAQTLLAGKTKAIPPDFVKEVNQIARSAPASAKFGSKVFIGYVSYAYTGQHGISDGEFKKMLLEAQRSGGVQLARADMVEVMNPADVRASTTYHESGFGEFQLIVPKGINMKTASEINCPECGGDGCGQCGQTGRIQVADDKNKRAGDEYEVADLLKRAGYARAAANIRKQGNGFIVDLITSGEKDVAGVEAALRAAGYKVAYQAGDIYAAKSWVADDKMIKSRSIVKKLKGHRFKFIGKSRTGGQVWFRG